MKLPCFILYGPTASGKSKLAYELANLLPIEIVNMDSVQVFNDFNIGAAKPDKLVLKKITHHLINIVSVPDHFSVATYLEKLHQCLKDILRRKKIPLLVGGTMLYLKAILDGGLSEIPNIDLYSKGQIYGMLECLTQRQRYDLLLIIDPEWSLQIHPNDVQRTMRGLVVYFAHGCPISSYKNTSSNYNFDPILIAIDGFDRSWLHKRIELRTDEMLKMGLINEVTNLIKKYSNNLDHFAFRSIGYKQVIDMIKQKSSIDELKIQINTATRQFAKRQITWMRRYNPDLIIDPNNYSLKKTAKWLISHGN